LARETRKLKRAQGGGPSTGKAAREALKAPPQRGQMLDPLGSGQLKSLLVRLGLILAGVWILFGSIAGFVSSSTWSMVLIAVPAALSVAAVGILLWTLRQAKTARGVASILSGVETDEDRKAALE
jgi:hypothetical protein